MYSLLRLEFIFQKIEKIVFTVLDYNQNHYLIINTQF